MSGIFDSFIFDRSIFDVAVIESAFNTKQDPQSASSSASIEVEGGIAVLQAGDIFESFGVSLIAGEAAPVQNSNAIIADANVDVAAQSLIGQSRNQILAVGIVRGWGVLRPAGSELWQEFMPDDATWTSNPSENGVWSPVTLGGQA